MKDGQWYTKDKKENIYGKTATHFDLHPNQPTGQARILALD
jgi:hypothetical protein